MLSTNQTIFILAFCALIVLIAVTYHWPKIVRAFADPPPKPTEPEGIADFKAEDWAHFEKFSPELMIWKPLADIDVERWGGYARAEREGMCRKCFRKIDNEAFVFPWSGSWIHRACAVEIYNESNPKMPAMPTPTVTDDEIVNGIRGNGRPKPPPGNAGVVQRRPPLGGSGQCRGR